LGLGLANSVSVWSWVINNTVIVRVRIGLGSDTGQIPAIVISGGRRFPRGGPSVRGTRFALHSERSES